MEPTQGVLTKEQKDDIKEDIKFNTELIKIFTLIALALATGISSLLNKLSYDYKTKLLFILGLVVFATFVILTISFILTNKKHLRRLKNV